jgi:phosphate-selective porin OprO and OprP
MTQIRVFTAAALILSCITLFGQTTQPYFNFGKGLGIISPDSSFSINTRFRIQNRFAFSTESDEDLQIKEVEARVRRTRLRFDGFVHSPKLTYLLQLSFSRGDMDFESMNFPNIIRDAYIQYSFNKYFSIGIGQTKLPGNRQRVNSSGDLQLADRSIVNTAFNIDRDFGLQFSYKREYFTLRGALSSGEGRNITTSDNGLAYTGRVEVLPFGSFSKNGDYFEGDLAREKSPKLSIGFVAHQNDHAVRTGGQTGYMLTESRNISSRMFDLLYKYNGWAFAAEYIERTTANPTGTDTQGKERYVYTGAGQNCQLSYIFKNNFEIVTRYSNLDPAKEIALKEKAKTQYTIGFNKYIKGHRVKIQNDITLEHWHLDTTEGKFWNYRFQVELGI